MLRTKNQSKYIHGNLFRDRIYGQTAKYRKTNTPFYQTILKYRTTELVLLLFQILGSKHNMSICNIALSINGITTNSCYCGCLPVMFKEPERRMNRHAHSTRLQAHSHGQTKQGIRALFSRGPLTNQP